MFSVSFALALTAMIGTAALMDVDDANVDAFRARGGKMLMMHGTVDMTIPPANTIALHTALSKRYGAELGGFSRFYIAPGVGHADGAFRPVWSAIETLDQRRDQDVVPGPQVMTDSFGAPGARQRPLCEYPAFPRYDGRGDPAAAASFSCAVR